MITCSLCEFQAFSKGNLTFHLNSVHFRDKEFMCRLCHFKTAYKGALTRHVNSVHLRTGKTKECPICGYVTSSLLNLNSHLSVSHHLEIATAFARPLGSTTTKNKEETINEEDTSPPSQGASSPDRHPASSPPLQPQDQEDSPLHPLQHQAIRLQRPAVPPSDHDQQQQIMYQHHLLKQQQPDLGRHQQLSASAAAAAASVAAAAAFSSTSSPLVLPPQAHKQPTRIQPDNRYDCHFCDFSTAEQETLAAHYNLAHLVCGVSGMDTLLLRQRQQQQQQQRQATLEESKLAELVDRTEAERQTFLRMKFLKSQRILEQPLRRDNHCEFDENNALARSREDVRDLRMPSSPSIRCPPPSPPSATAAPLPPQAHLAPQHHHHLIPYELLLRCRLCEHQATSAAYLRNHIRTVHLEEVHDLSCPECEYTSDHPADIRAHLELEHGGGSGGGGGSGTGGRNGAGGAGSSGTMTASKSGIAID